MWCPMMPAHSWRTLLGSPSAYGVKTPLINPNYAGGHRLSSLIRGVPPTSRVSASEASPRRHSKSLPYRGVRRTPRADRPGSLQDHRAVHSRRHQPRGVAVRRSVIDRVARVHRCRHGDVHAHPSDGDHAEPNGHPPTHPTARSPAALDTSGHHTSSRRTTTSPHTPTTRDRGSAVPQVALALPAAPPPTTRATTAISALDG
jgi:hypothetical protein